MTVELVRDQNTGVILTMGESSGKREDRRTAELNSSNAESFGRGKWRDSQSDRSIG